ncbi:MAG: hypothetical protein ACI4F4_01695 [Lachnospiraceae bacterium]
MYQIMFIGGMAGTFIFFLLSVFLFVKNDVRKRIGDLTGANARKAIKESYEKSHKNQKVLEGESAEIMIREKPAQKDSVKKSLKVEKKHKTEEWALGDEATELLNDSRDLEEATELLQTEIGDEATELLQTNDIGEEVTELLQTNIGDDATELLRYDNDPEATDVLYQYQDEETELLSQEETAVLLQNVTETLVGEESTEPLYEEVNISEGDMDSILNGAVNSGEEMVAMPDIFEVEEDVTVVHTDETI